MKTFSEKELNFLKPHILYTYEFKCCLCGKKSLSNHVHHADFDRSNNEPGNLVVVCKEHHKMVHKNKFVLNIIRTRIQELCLEELALALMQLDVDYLKKVNEINVKL